MTRSEPAALLRRLSETFPERVHASGACWIVGGALRDLLLDRPSPDVDLACRGAEAAARDFARSTGGRVVPLGGDRFPTWRVVTDDRGFDFTELTGISIDADLGRRDFTINAMALSVAEPVSFHDPFGGERDLADSLIRMVRRENLEDDPLRVLKAVRLAAALRFRIEDQTLEACRELASRVEAVAAERVGAELETMFREGDPAIAADLLRRTGLDRVVLRREAPAALARIPSGDPIAAWAVILWGADDAEIREYADRLRWPSSASAELRRIAQLDRALDANPSQADLAIFDAGESAAHRLVAIRSAVGDRERARELQDELARRGGGFFTTTSFLSGNEIAEIAGIRPGPDVGRLKRALLVAQLRGEVTSPENAAAWLRRKSSE